MPSEFELIRRHFERPAGAQSPGASGVLLGVGDDCALMARTPGTVLAVSTDMLVEGRHFSAGDDARLLGHKALAVNLSDLAAMGATPRWATLALALPAADEAWLRDFSAGLFALADRHGLSLVGGDTTRGPLNLCITVMGEVPEGAALRRDGARAGDEVWVSGELGAAALGLACVQGQVALQAPERAHALARLHAPEPRVALGLRLRGLASAAIDVSDGLAGDLGHILARSRVSARIEFARLPRPGAFARLGDRALEARCLLSGGDDYELAFTAPAASHTALRALSDELGLALTCIGRIEPAGPGPALQVLEADGQVLPVAGGYDHFADPT